MIRTVLFLLIAAGAAVAQGDPTAEIRKKMEEIAVLMRESEQTLLEISMMDRLVQQQSEVARKLEELLKQPPSEDNQAAVKEFEEKRAELEERQNTAERRIRDLFEAQEKKGALVERSLEELLKNLPRGQGTGPGGHDKRNPQRSEEDEKRLQDERERRERKQREEEARRQEDSPEGRQRRDRRQEDDITEAQRKFVDAWMARLPPEELERVNRGDFSHVPLRYRPLVERLTIERSRREAEEQR